MKVFTITDDTKRELADKNGEIMEQTYKGKKITIVHCYNGGFYKCRLFTIKEFDNRFEFVVIPYGERTKKTMTFYKNGKYDSFAIYNEYTHFINNLESGIDNFFSYIDLQDKYGFEKILYYQTTFAIFYKGYTILKDNNDTYSVNRRAYYKSGFKKFDDAISFIDNK